MQPPPDRFLAEIQEQPEALRRAARAMEERQEDLRRFAAMASGEGTGVLTGMGSSFAACLAAASVLGRSGAMATTVNAAELVNFRSEALGPDSLVIAVSQSGGSAEVVRLAEMIRGAEGRLGTLVAVTNGRENPLTPLSDLAFDTAAGPELGPSTKTFAATLVALWPIVALLTGRREVPEVLAEVRAHAVRAAEHAEALVSDPSGTADLVQARVGDRPSLAVLGRGSARAAAEVGALVLKEAARYPAEAFDTAQFRHGPVELAGPDLAVALISAEPSTVELDRRLAHELAEHGSPILVVGDPAVAPPGAGSVRVERLDPLISPAATVIPLQLLAWRLAVSRGHTPHRLVRASKVTTIE